MGKWKETEYKFAHFITKFAGSMPFVYFHTAWFALWIIFKVEAFPFGLLTMIVSLEAIFLSTFIMISQNLEMQYTAQQEAEEDVEEAHTRIELQDIQKDLDEIKELVKRKK